MRVHDEWLLTPDRVAVHEPSATAVVADLHLGYLEARRQAGDATPLVPLATLLGPLGRALKRTKAARLVIAGDLFEKRFLADLWAEFTDWLKRRGVALVGVVLGNHDRRWPQAEASVCRDALPLGDWQIVHGHLPVEGERVVCGHFHPAMRHGGRLAPCYLIKENRLVLPAYSQDAAGGDVWSLPGWDGWRCLVIQGRRVADVGIIRRRPPADLVVGKPGITRARRSPWRARLRPG